VSSGPYRQRRDLLASRISDEMILVRGAGPEGSNPNFFYLTGIDEPAGALILSADLRVGVGRASPGSGYVHGRRVQQALFLPEHDELATTWGEQGAATTRSINASDVGFDVVLPSGGLAAVLSSNLQQAERLHYVRAAAPSLLGDEDADADFVTRIRQRFIGLQIADATPVVHEMRQSKDPIEIEAIERAVRVTAAALDALVGTLRPGLREHEAEAEIARAYRAAGATHAFEPIVACGPNALKLHYRDNAGPVESGRLLLVDTGACLNGYRSDITRTLPVDGRFDERQREVYETVLRAQQAAIEACRPGALLGDLHAEAFAVIDDAGFGAYFIHGTGHHLGLATHDVGDIHRPLTPGAVITIEPGIYLPDEQIGVRIEDDVLITNDGYRVLSTGIPKTVTDVEAWMAQ
jgi:Xaa-Pro aminopeptidase